jgi:hypothetical protein
MTLASDGEVIDVLYRMRQHRASVSLFVGRHMRGLTCNRELLSYYSDFSAAKFSGAPVSNQLAPSVSFIITHMK